MINVKEYSGHIRNWSALCERLGIDHSLSREEQRGSRFSSKHMRPGEMKWRIICTECLHLHCGMMKNRNYSV